MGKALSLLFVGILWAVVHQASAASKRCPSIDIENGRARIKSRGRVAKFKCRRGFKMFEGDKFATCVRGRWNGKIPKCITNGCDHYESIPNGEAMYMLGDAYVQFLCRPGYVLEGSGVLTCDGSEWNDTIPICKAPKNVALSCDFEDDTACGWLNGDQDEFDWTRNQGPTASFGIGTGPQADHTLGTVLGHYMYIDASIPRTTGDMARLYSPVYPPSSTHTLSCFAFYYHMFGNTSGHLNIYILGDQQDILSEPPIYQMSGFNQDMWILHVIHFDRLLTNFQIVVEGVRGPHYTSDVAIDDVKLAQGDECKELDDEVVSQYVTLAPLTTTTPVPDTTTEPSPPNSPSTNGTAAPQSSDSPTTTPELSTIVDTQPPSLPSTSISVTVTVPMQTSNTTQTSVPTSTIQETQSPTSPTVTPPLDPAVRDDLTSCQDRCGEIAVESDDCGCDIECGNDNSCCLDVEDFCDLSTPPPIPLTPKINTTVIDTIPSATSLPPPDSTEMSSITTLQSISVNPTVIDTSTQPEETTTAVGEKSGEEEIPETTSIPSGTVVEGSSTLTTTSEEMTTTDLPSYTPIPTSNSDQIEANSTVTSNASTMASNAATIASTAVTVISTAVTMASTAVTMASTTVTMASSALTMASTALTMAPPTKKVILVYTTSTTISTTSTTEPTEALLTTEASTSLSSKTEPPKNTTITSAESGAQKKGLSRSATYGIAIGTVTALILVGILLLTYIKKRKRDKLPEDSDIRFLARDEVMMEGNIFNLSGTITQVRNSAI